jgi:hypothetical protein
MRLLVDKDVFSDLVSKYKNGGLHKTPFKMSNYYVWILSKDKIMRRANGRLETATIRDGESRLVVSNGREFIGDTSKIEFTETRDFQLPTRTSEIIITHLVFKLAKNSVVSLNYELIGNGTVRDAWFDIDDGFVDNAMAMEDVDTFLRQ